jgi:hypothetical protein
VLAGGSFEFKVILQVCDVISARMRGLVGAGGNSLHHLQFEYLMAAVVEVAVQDLESCMFAVPKLWSAIVLWFAESKTDVLSMTSQTEAYLPEPR